MKTKILVPALLLTVAFSACNDDKAEEKNQLDMVIAIHDKVMAADETAMKNRKTLDSLLKGGKIQDTSGKTTLLIQGIDKADNEMENWMHQFNPDYTGKSHTEVMEYLHSQRLQIEGIDSTLNTLTERSSQYLLQLKNKKP